jgi:hypothetical protein
MYLYLLLYVVWHCQTSVLANFMCYLPPLLTDLLYKDYNFDQKFSLSTSSSSGLVRVLCLYFSLFPPQNSLSLFFLITFVFVIESHGHWCEDQ